MTQRHLCRVTPENIIELKTNEIIINPSNKAGIHGAGLARLCFNKWGAKWGQGAGIAGQTYSIPTKDENIQTMQISDIKPYVDDFTEWAKYHTGNIFLVPKIGTGLAGISVEDIAPLFAECIDIENISLPQSFINIIIN